MAAGARGLPQAQSGGSGVEPACVGIQLAADELPTGLASSDKDWLASSPDDYPMMKARSRLPLSSKLALSFPLLGWNAAIYMKTSYMRVFYVDGHPQASLGFIALSSVAAVLVDAFSDPIMANWTDNIRPGCLGRRRVFVTVAGVSTVLVFTLSWTPLLPAGLGASVWYGGMHVLSRLCETVFLIPLQGWLAEASPSASERSGLWMLYQVFEVSGILMGAVLPGFLTTLGGTDCNDPKNGCVSFPLVSFAFSMLMLVGCVVLTLYGRERPNDRLPIPRRQGWSEDGIVPTMISTWLNRPFRVLLVCALITAFGDALPFVVLPFLTRGLLGDACMDPSLTFSMLAGVTLVVRILSLPVWSWVTRLLGKFHTYVSFTIILTVAHICFVLVQEDSGDCAQTALAGAVAGFWGASLGGYVLLKSLLSDVVDYDEFVTGKRREGQYLMAIDFLPKFLTVLSEAAPLLLLAYLGYRRASSDDPVPQQPEAVKWVLRLCLSLVPAGFIGLGGCALFWYPKQARNEQSHRVLIEAIAKHRRGLEAEDPWFPGRSLPPPAAPTAHSGLLSYLLPSEILAMIGEGSHEPNLMLPVWSMLKWVALAAPLASVGVVLLVVGQEDLTSDLGASLSPVGLILVGSAVLLAWFHGTRALAVRRIAEAQVPRAELISHYNTLCRSLGEPPFKPQI